MTLRKVVGVITTLFVVALLALTVLAQRDQGKAEMKAGSGGITVNYGRPTSNTDRVGELKVGGPSWRMGKNDATVFTTPMDLMFGITKIPKGSYSLWLNRVAEDKYELVFNSQTGQWGTSHDVSKDFAKVPLQKERLSPLVETFTIDLKPNAKGGTFIMTWGTTKLSGDFQFK